LTRPQRQTRRGDPKASLFRHSARYTHHPSRPTTTDHHHHHHLLATTNKPSAAARRRFRGRSVPPRRERESRRIRHEPALAAADADAPTPTHRHRRPDNHDNDDNDDTAEAWQPDSRARPQRHRRQVPTPIVHHFSSDPQVRPCRLKGFTVRRPRRQTNRHDPTAAAQ
jgi:hypothetical protein